MNYSKQSSLICFIDAPCDNYIEVVLGHLIKSLKSDFVSIQGNLLKGTLIERTREIYTSTQSSEYNLKGLIYYSK